MTKLLSIFLILCLFPYLLSAQQKVFNIVDFGAVGDGITLNTVAIQKAIDAASLAKGRVSIPKGRFVSGTIELKSNINLHLAEGAVLLGSDKRADYGDAMPLAFIKTENQKNITITGKGTIDGQARQLMADIFKRLKEGTLTDPEWKTKRPTEKNRPYLVYFNNCEGITVRQIQLKDGATWVHHCKNSKNIVMDSVCVESVAYWNNDGLDFTDCQDVVVSNCNINSADDAICLKSEDRNRLCENYKISNCTLRSSANAFKLGTSSHGGFKNIVVNNLIVYDTYRSAIALEAVDGGILENVRITNITAKNTGNAIFIKLGHRNKDSVYSKLSNIYIANVKVEVPSSKPDKGYEMEGPLMKYPPNVKPEKGKIISVSPYNHTSKDSLAIIYEHNVFPSSVTGLPGHPVKNVTLENIEITYEGGGNAEKAFLPVDSLHIITEAEKSYPEFSMFGELPAWGFYVRHVEGLTIKNFTLKLKKPDYRVAAIFDDVKTLNLEKFQVPYCNTLPVIVLNKTKNVKKKNLSLSISEKEAIRER
jgi:hypothetical protein